MFTFDAKMGDFTPIGKGKEIPQRDPKDISIEDCKMGTGLQIRFLYF